MLTPQQAWGSGLAWRPVTAAGVAVTTEAAMQAAIGACVRLLTDDIAGLPVDVIRKVDGASVPSNRPAWLEYPTGRRFDTFQMHLSDVLVSLLTNGNAFIECAPSTVNPSFFKVHDPETVAVEHRGGGVVYTVRALGTAKEFSDLDMVHIPWIRLPGKVRGLSVLEASSDSSGLEIAARQWAGEFFANGATLGNVVEFPTKPTREELEIIRETMTAQHSGRGKAWKLGILTGGAKMAENVLKPAEADLAPLWRHVLEEAARLYHIPPHLLGSQESGASSYASVEHRSIEYVVHAVVPIVTRLENAYSRFLGRDRFVKLNVNALLRGDVKTRAESWAFYLQNKVVTPSYVAAKEDFPPEQAAEGWLETPNNNGPRDAAPAASAERSEPVSISVSTPPVNVTAPPVTVTSYVSPDAQEKAERAADLMVADTRDSLQLVEVAVAESNQRTLDYVEERMAQAEARAAASEERLQAELERLRAITPVTREVGARDEHGRVLTVIERRGDVEVRKVIERDERGQIVRVLEVPAA